MSTLSKFNVNAPVLFVSGKDSFTPAHVLAAAALWCELEPLCDAVQQRLASQAHAEAEGTEVSGETLQAASEAFRRARGLRTAQATEAWMDSWGVSVEAFTDYLEREALHAALNGQLPADALPEKDARPALDLLWHQAVFSGASAGWCLRLAARVAVAQESDSGQEAPSSLFEPAAAPDHSPDALQTWVRQTGLSLDWYDRMLACETAFARFAESVQTPARMDAVLHAEWTALFTIDFELGAFASEAAAREACLCITEDGVTMAQVCQMAGGYYQEGRTLLGNLPDTVHAHALSAAPDSLLPVFSWQDQFVVCRVRSKAEPSLDDAPTREHAGRQVLDDAVRPLLEQHITWHVRGLE